MQAQPSRNLPQHALMSHGNLPWHSEHRKKETVRKRQRKTDWERERETVHLGVRQVSGTRYRSMSITSKSPEKPLLLSQDDSMRFQQTKQNIKTPQVLKASPFQINDLDFMGISPGEPWMIPGGAPPVCVISEVWSRQQRLNHLDDKWQQKIHKKL